MFSGLKSFLFGNVDDEINSLEQESKQDVGTSDLSEAEAKIVLPTSPSQPTLGQVSAIIEKSINVATSLIQEQLNVPSTSIEKLRVSAHELLPSLDEKTGEIETNLSSQDNSFDEDPWELLDIDDIKESIIENTLPSNEEQIKESKEKKSGLSRTAQEKLYKKQPSLKKIQVPSTISSISKPKKDVRPLTKKSSPSVKHVSKQQKYVEKDEDKLVNISTSSSNTSNDSVKKEAVDMDESWFVTPPPCFTGANTFKKECKSQKKEAADFLKPFQPSSKSGSLNKRSTEVASFVTLDTDDNSISQSYSSTELENMLIEHPSIYIPRSLATKTETEDESIVQQCFDAKNEKQCNKTKPTVTNLLEGVYVGSHLQNNDSKMGPSCGGIAFNLDSSTGDKSESFHDDSDLSPSKSENILIVQRTAKNEDESSQSNSLTTSSSEGRRETKKKGKRAVVKTKQTVKPIKPERAPAWQLKRKRSHRKPLAESNSNCSNNKKGSSKKRSSFCHYPSSASDSSMSTNSRSSSSSANLTRNLLFDRINSTIVENLNNIEATLGPQPGHFVTMVNEDEPGHRLEARYFDSNRRKLNSKFTAEGQKLVSSYMSRKNKVVLRNNSSKRAQRRTKMNTRLNGISVNRKVHTNFTKRTVSNKSESGGHS